MNDLLIFFATIIGLVVIGMVIWFFERITKCWHSFGPWTQENTSIAYVQSRSCNKCGYTEREQWKKLKLDQ